MFYFELLILLVKNYIITICLYVHFDLGNSSTYRSREV